MRRVLAGDVQAAAGALMAWPASSRSEVLRGWLIRATAADRYRKRFGRAHPDWGNGTLMSLVRRGRHPPEPSLGDMEYLRCCAVVLDGLVAWRCSRQDFRA